MISAKEICHATLCVYLCPPIPKMRFYRLFKRSHAHPSPVLSLFRCIIHFHHPGFVEPNLSQALHVNCTASIAVR
jgi:hypothetical protein